MIIHCSRCDINWLGLWHAPMNNTDETVEFCPKCETDMFLGSATDIVAYIKCPVTGKIVNPLTGEQHPSEFPVRPPGKPRRIVIWDESFEEWKAKDEKLEDDILAEYVRLYDSGMPSATAFRKATASISRPQRKFHYEQY